MRYRRAGADSNLASIVRCTNVAVVTRVSRQWRDRTGRGAIASPRVALVGSTRDSRADALAAPIAMIIERAGVGVVTSGRARRRRVRAYAGRRVASSSHVTLITRGAHYGIRSSTSSSLTSIGPRAGVAVVTCRAIWLLRI